MTGTHCHTCGGFTHQQTWPLRDLPTMGTVFRDAGYATGTIGKVHISGEDEARDFGFDERALRIYTYQWREYIEAIGQDNVDRYATYNEGSRVPRRPPYNPANDPGGVQGWVIEDLVTVSTGGYTTYMYRYESSRPTATGGSAGAGNDVRSCSRDAVIPWGFVTYYQAKRACARAGSGNVPVSACAGVGPVIDVKFTICVN